MVTGTSKQNELDCCAFFKASFMHSSRNSHAFDLSSFNLKFISDT